MDPLVCAASMVGRANLGAASTSCGPVAGSLRSARAEADAYLLQEHELKQEGRRRIAAGIEPR